jgi:vacuolar-type H+-ATPase subunit E/Vma4
MAIDDLILALRAQGEAEGRAILEAARTEAAAIVARAQAADDARRAALAADREQARRMSVETGLAEARRTARQASLEARSVLLDRVLDAVRGELPRALVTPPCRDALAAQLAEARACLGGKAGRVRCHPAVETEVRAALAGSPLEFTADASAGSGFQLGSTDGALLIDATLEARLAQRRQQVLQAVLTALGDPP